AVETDRERAGRLRRNERDLAELLVERGEQLLREPRRSKEPPALRTVFDFDARLWHGFRPGGEDHDPRDRSSFASGGIIWARCRVRRACAATKRRSFASAKASIACRIERGCSSSNIRANERIRSGRCDSRRSVSRTCA